MSLSLFRVLFLGVFVLERDDMDGRGSLRGRKAERQEGKINGREDEMDV